MIQSCQLKKNGFLKKNNLTEMQLAERAELSLDSIKRVENGKITLSLDNFLRLADAMDVLLSCLIYSGMEIIHETERVLYITRKEQNREGVPAAYIAGDGKRIKQTVLINQI